MMMEEEEGGEGGSCRYTGTTGCIGVGVERPGVLEAELVQRKQVICEGTHSVNARWMLGFQM